LIARVGLENYTQSQMLGSDDSSAS
jgi:hypothetical protein